MKPRDWIASDYKKIEKFLRIIKKFLAHGT